MNFPEWEDDSILPTGLERIKTEKSAEIHSYVWQGSGIRRARLCVLNIPGKFTAETLVIYPSWETETPIFGTEYITIANKKFFGAIDFHPLSQDEGYLKTWIDGHLGEFPVRSVEESKFYDLSKYFSSRFWIKKSDQEFHDEYLDRVDMYAVRYRRALEGGRQTSSNKQAHVDYDTHMAVNDPAHGILKSYFSDEFADFYVNKFLFDLSEK